MSNDSLEIVLPTGKFSIVLCSGEKKREREREKEREIKREREYMRKRDRETKS